MQPLAPRRLRLPQQLLQYLAPLPSKCARARARGQDQAWMRMVLHPFSVLPAWQPGPGCIAEHPYAEHPPSALAGSKLGPCDPIEIFFSSLLLPSVIFELRPGVV